MFESIRDKLFPSSSIDTSVKVPEDDGVFSVNAGAALLEKYQMDWTRLHNVNEINAKKAEEVDKRIGSLNAHCERHWERVGSFLQQLTSLPNAKEDLLRVTKKLTAIESSFRDLEKALLYLENTIEIQEMQVKQLDDRFDLTLHTERRRADFENARERLAMQHENKVVRFEAEKKGVLHERQEAFQEAFDGDMEYYKKHGKIEKVNSLKSNEENLKLEDVELEHGCDDLDVFLGAEASGDKDSADTKEDSEPSDAEDEGAPDAASSTDNNSVTTAASSTQESREEPS